MKYSPPENFEKIANPEFSYLDTLMFMVVSNFSEDENDLVSEIYAILEIEFPDDTFDKRTICHQWRRSGHSYHTAGISIPADIMAEPEWQKQFRGIRPAGTRQNVSA